MRSIKGFNQVKLSSMNFTTLWKSSQRFNNSMLGCTERKANYLTDGWLFSFLLYFYIKNDIIYLFSQSWAVFFRHRNNLTPQHQIVGQVIEVSVICMLDNFLGKQPWPWFSWEGPCCPQQHCKATELEWRKCFWKGCPRALACCSAGKMLEFSLLLRSCPTVQISIIKHQLWPSLCKGTGATNVQSLGPCPP